MTAWFYIGKTRLVVRYNSCMLEILFCIVIGITDGDTLKARCGEPGNYEQVRVRISAIDAPERGQDYSAKAREYLSDLCYQVNAKIIVHGHDRYGRIVGQVTVTMLMQDRHC